MTFYEKYPQLKQKQFVYKLVCENVYATMALENQTVPMDEIEKIVTAALEKEELKQGEFFFN